MSSRDAKSRSRGKKRGSRETDNNHANATFETHSREGDQFTGHVEDNGNDGTIPIPEDYQPHLVQVSSEVARVPGQLLQPTSKQAIIHPTVSCHLHTTIAFTDVALESGQKTSSLIDSQSVVLITFTYYFSLLTASILFESCEAIHDI